MFADIPETFSQTMFEAAQLDPGFNDSEVRVEYFFINDTILD